MNNEFTKEEKQLVQDYANTTTTKRIGFYLMILFTPLVAEIYGVMEKDIPAMVMGFLGVFVLVIWLLLGSWGDAKLLSSICSKILDKWKTVTKMVCRIFNNAKGYPNSEDILLSLALMVGVPLLIIGTIIYFIVKKKQDST